MTIKISQKKKNISVLSWHHYQVKNAMEKAIYTKRKGVKKNKLIKTCFSYNILIWQAHQLIQWAIAVHVAVLKYNTDLLKKSVVQNILLPSSFLSTLSHYYVFWTLLLPLMSASSNFTHNTLSLSSCFWPPVTAWV